jgi:hypothetical protein
MTALPVPHEPTTTDVWGASLNNWLLVGHQPDGKLKTGYVNVLDYGAVPNNSTGPAKTSNGVAFASAAATGKTVYVPSGDWYGTWNLDPAIQPMFVGSFSGDTRIMIDSGQYFVDGNRLWGTPLFQNLTFEASAGGGSYPGAIRNRYTGGNVTRLHRVIDCTFLNFTGAAISHNSSDMPFWKILRNVFFAANDTTSIAIALSGLTDQCVIADNSFQRYKVGVKLARGGNNAKIENNDFVQYDAPVGGNLRTAVWLVPHTSTTNAGQGFHGSRNKHGSENLGAADRRFLLADEGSGTYFGDKLPATAADSTGYIVGMSITDSPFNGSGGVNIPMVYSTTPNVWGSRIAGNRITGDRPSYVIEVRTPTANPEPELASNLIGPILADDNNFTPFPVSNQVGVGSIYDPQGLLLPSQRPVIERGGARSSGYVKLLQQRINNFTLATATKSAITDSIGDTDAAEVTFPGEIYMYVPTGALVTDKPLWVEFEILQGTSSPLTSLYAQVGLDTAPNGNHMRRVIIPDASWRVHRLQIRSASTSNSTLLKFKPGPGSSGTKVRIGRVRMYHAYEPVLTDLELPDVTTTTTAPSAGGQAIPTAARFMRVYVNGAPYLLPLLNPS